MRLREAHGQVATAAEDRGYLGRRDAPPSSDAQTDARKMRQFAPESRNAPANSTRHPSRRTAEDRQTYPAPRGAEGIPAHQGAAEEEDRDAQSFAATHPSKFGCAKTPSAVGAKTIDAQSTTDAIPKATGTEERQQPAKRAPPELNLSAGEICPERRVATCGDRQGTCGTSRQYIRSLATEKKMAAQAFQANADQPDLEERQLFNAAFVVAQGGEIANQRFRTHMFRRSAAGRQKTFKTSDEVIKLAFAATPKKEYYAERHPAPDQVCEARALGNPWAKTAQSHLVPKKDFSATSRNSFALAARTKVGQMESHSLQAEQCAENVTCQSCDATAPRSPTGERKPVPAIAMRQTGTPSNTQRREYFSLCDSRDLSSETAKKPNFEPRDSEAAERHGIYDNAHQQRRESLVHSYPCEQNYDEMLIRLRLLAEQDAPRNTSPRSSKGSICAATKEVDSQTLIDAIERRTRLAILCPAVAQSANENVWPPTGTHEGPGQKWNEVACCALEEGEAKGAAQWYLAREDRGQRHCEVPRHRDILNRIRHRSRHPNGAPSPHAPRHANGSGKSAVRMPYFPRAGRK